MDLVNLDDAAPHDPERFVAVPFLDGERCNARLIRLAAGQALPPHTHGESELLLFAVEGDAELDTPDGVVAFGRGSLARFAGSEELRVSNPGTEPVTLLAYLSPPFPPR